MKHFFATAAMLCLLVSALAGCSGSANNGPASEQQQRSEAVISLEREGMLQEGGDVTFSRDSDGNLSYSYQNPDGSCGGGVTYD